MSRDRAGLSWPEDGRDWPNREASRFVSAAGLSWHVQSMGQGPRMLLIHGTGASTHSFRDLAPLLAGRYEVVLPDLPGHGFTAMPHGRDLSLPGMAGMTGALLAKIGFSPEIAVGHSAGAAILIEMTLAGLIAPRLLVALNGALTPIRGASLFSPLAKLLFLNPLAPRLLAWRALSREATRRVIEGTGSAIDERGIALYQRLFSSPGHVAGALGMMAHWDLGSFERRIARLAAAALLVTAADDRAVPPGTSATIVRRMRCARHLALPSGGHLVHEERPAEIAEIIAGAAQAPETRGAAGSSVCQI